MKRFSWILTLPLLAVAVVFAIANREWVTLDLWPFDLSLRLPLFVVLLASLFVGLSIGGLAAWLSAGRTRRRGRRQRRRIEELERDVARLGRERDRAARTTPPATPSAAGDGRAGLPAPTPSAAGEHGHHKRAALGR